MWAVEDADRPTVEVVVPVYNEQRDLERCVRQLHAYLSSSFPFPFLITIADNASTDATWPLARRLAGELEHLRAVHLDAKGRGLALREVWGASPAAVLAYMDVDLSTGLEALLPLVAPLVSGHSDVAIGTRLSPGARVVRGPKREVISRGYNLLLHATLGTRFSDAQCGFKAIRADAARRLLPQVRDDGWFFDTELLVLAERAGLRIPDPRVWRGAPNATAQRPSRWRRLLRGRLADPGWVRPSLLLLLAATALLYLVGLGASGYANSFYSAAVQAGTRSWKAMFFGSSDASSFITVDKPAAALLAGAVMALTRSRC